MTTGQICGHGYRPVPFTAYEVSCRVRTERCPFCLAEHTPELVPPLSGSPEDLADKNYAILRNNYCGIFISRILALVKQKSTNRQYILRYKKSRYRYSQTARRRGGCADRQTVGAICASFVPTLKRQPPRVFGGCCVPLEHILRVTFALDSFRKINPYQFGL